MIETNKNQEFYCNLFILFVLFTRNLKFPPLAFKHFKQKNIIIIFLFL